MVDYYTNKQEGISHSSIVHELLRKIALELGTKEFRGGYYNQVSSNNSMTKTYVTDARREYVQAVEALSSILIPFFDEKMKEEYEKYENSITKHIVAYNKESSAVKGNELNSNDSKENQTYIADISEGSQTFQKLYAKKLMSAKLLFKDLNLLLNRTNYLKSNPYSEGDDEEEKEGFEE
jgi:hypothetical protein